MTVPIALLMQVPMMLAIGALGLFVVLRRRRSLLEAKPHATPDGLSIPVNALFVRSGRFFEGMQRNSMRPELAIGRDGIRFRAVTRGHWPFADIAHVEARERRGGWKLVFVGRPGRGVVAADILGEANVLAALRALPDSVALTPQAAVLRDGSAAAGVTNLRLYSGRLR